MSLGENLRKARKEVGLTLEQVAIATHSTKANLSRYENGSIVNIPAVKIEKLADIYQTTPNHLMGWEEEKQQKFSSKISELIFKFSESKCDVKSAVDYTSGYLSNIQKDVVFEAEDIATLFECLSKLPRA